MRRCIFLVLILFWSLQAQAPSDLVKKIQDELMGPFPPPEAKVDPSVPHGEFLEGSFSDSKIYPGTENRFQVYVPAEYDPAKPACLLVKLDGLGSFEGTVLDNLIARKEVPVMIGVGIVPGSISSGGKTVRFNRSYEFDSMNNRFPDFVLNELLPRVQAMKTRDGRLIRLSMDGNDHAATGSSTGGIGSFTLAWQRPDQFTRVYSVIGTFVSMRGGNEYPVLIRKTDPKPIRIFLEDGSTDAWNPLFGSWYDANLNMDSALSFAGYDVAHAWGTHGHNGQAGQVIFPDVMRWLWRDYPAPIKAGVSANSTLQEITIPEEGWRKATAGEKGQPPGPDGTRYGSVPGEKNLAAAKSIVGYRSIVTHDGTVYVSEPGATSRIWRIKGGEKKLMDEGTFFASGIAFSPDGKLFYVADKKSKCVYSYVVQPDGSFTDRQPFFWLHTSDIEGDSGAEDLAVDTHGNLYVATRLGIQICDQNGRVRAILPLPAPSGAARRLWFGGPDFDVLYATDGTQVFSRKLKVRGYAPWSAPIAVTSQGAG
jgi:enterochelin esterase-like enzyme